MACTFGSSITTFEHFASNVWHRVGVKRELTNEASLPDDIVRLGIECESTVDIASELSFVLNSALKYTKT